MVTEGAWQCQASARVVRIQDESQSARSRRQGSVISANCGSPGNRCLGGKPGNEKLLLTRAIFGESVLRRPVLLCDAFANPPLALF